MNISKRHIILQFKKAVTMKKEKLKPDYLTQSGQIQQPNIKNIYEFFQMILLFAGILLSLKDLMYTFHCFMIALVSGTIVLILHFLSQNSKVWTRRIDLMLYLIGLLALILSNLSLVHAILDICNRMIILCNVRFQTDFSKFAVTNKAFFGSIVLWFLFGTGIARNLYIHMKKRQFQIALLMIMLCLTLGFAFKTSTMFLASVFILLGILSIFLHDCAPERKLGIQFLETQLIYLLVIVLLMIVCFNYRSLQSIENIKQSVSDKIEEIRYGKDTLPKGDFSKSSDLLKGNDDRLKIEIDQPQELYLKGFVGGTYQKYAWAPLSMDHYEDQYEGIMNWLSKQKMDPITQYSIYQKLTLKQNDRQLNLIKVNIKNTGAYRKYVYLPSTVESFHAFRASQKKDWSVWSKRFFGTSDYKFQSFFYSQDLTFSNMQSWMKHPKTDDQKTYIKNESVYEQFVKDSYLDIDKNLKKELQNIFFKDSPKMDFSEVTTKVRKTLREKITYTKTPQNIDTKKDYISWLLQNKKEGNAVSYATVAVMAYRSYGYPARYVEGYHLSKDKASKMQKERKKSTTLTTKNAHAWVEIYRSGIGWIPVEVVPGMYTETYSDRTIQGKPSYQLKSKKDKSGINTAQGKSGNKKANNNDHKKPKKSFTIKNISTMFILLLYILLIIYLLLELQRIIRLSCFKKNQENSLSINDLTKSLGQLWTFSKIKGDYSHPMELEAAILSKYPEVYPMEYERVVSLIQKSRFGGQKLKPHEEHTLKCFVHKISHLLWHNSNIFDKILLRYVYLIPKE